MKKITFLIGNGFDKSCGLKTAYSDIYKRYVLTKSKTPTIRKFKKSIKNHETWADFEMAMCRYMTELDNEEQFIDCLHSFRDYMMKHLEKEEDRFSKIYKRKVKEFILKEVDDSIDDMKLCEEPWDAEYQAICFNYTNVAKKILTQEDTDDEDEIISRKGGYVFTDLVHIHGTLKNGPVLGINDVGQFSNKLKYKVTDEIKTEFVKPIFNQEYDKNRDEKAMAMIAESDIICVYGLSLGQSDIRWVDALSAWLRKSTERKLYVFDYSCFSSTEEHVAVKLNKVKRAAKLLEEKGIDTSSGNVFFPYRRHYFNFLGAIKKVKRKKERKKARLVCRIVFRVLSICSYIAFSLELLVVLGMCAFSEFNVLDYLDSLRYLNGVHTFLFELKENYLLQMGLFLLMGIITGVTSRLLKEKKRKKSFLEWLGLQVRCEP